MKNLPTQSNIKILEIGCSESSLSYELARMGHQVCAVDVNPYPFIHRNLKFLHGDITEIELPSAYFDCAVTVSTIEHIGMGWYSTAKKTEGDLLALQNTANSLKEHGLFFITVPVAPTYREIPGRTRIYDIKSLNKLIHFSDMNLNVVEYYMPTRKVGRHAFNWVRATQKDIIDGDYLIIYPHAVACLSLVKK